MPGPTMADAPDTPAPDHAGHGARLRTRLLGGDADGMADYELVEYLLALAIPRRDTKPLAKALLREFGSIAQLVAADPNRCGASPAWATRRSQRSRSSRPPAYECSRANFATSRCWQAGTRCSTGCAPTWGRSTSNGCASSISTRATC